MAAFFSSNRGKPIKPVLCILGLLLNMPASNEHKSIAIDDNKRYYKALSKTSSGQASRYTLAFFVPDNNPASQAVIMKSCTALRAHLSASRGHSLISIASHLLTDYDGLTLQNKRALRRICRAVTTSTESKTRHPILSVFNTAYSVALTHKLVGGSYHG